MLSRITVEVDFSNGNLSFIQVIEKHSDDVRDALIGHFLERLAHESRWCRIEYYGDDMRGRHWRIHPMAPQELPSEMKLMEALIKTENVV